MKRLTLILFSACLFLSSKAATWQEANDLYAESNYTEAIVAYETLLQDEPSAEAYYNLGNAYFKTGELAYAILSYERALRIYPRFKDADHNLRFAQTKIIDNIEDKHQFFLRQWAQTLRNQLTENQWFTLSLCAWIICLIGIFIFLFVSATIWRKVGFHCAWFTLIFAILTLWSGLSLHHRNTAREEAIIIQGIVNAKSSPDKSGTDLFVLHEGSKVRITDTVSEWAEIHVGDYVGWIRLNALERI